MEILVLQVNAFIVGWLLLLTSFLILGFPDAPDARVGQGGQGGQGGRHINVWNVAGGLHCFSIHLVSIA